MSAKTKSTLRNGHKETPTLVIHTRYYSATQIARCNGQTASSTMSHEAAAKRVAVKAARKLFDLKVISRKPSEDDIVLQEVGTGDYSRRTYHVHL